MTAIKTIIVLMTQRCKLRRFVLIYVNVGYSLYIFLHMLRHMPPKYGRNKTHRDKIQILCYQSTFSLLQMMTFLYVITLFYYHFSYYSLTVWRGERPSDLSILCSYLILLTLKMKMTHLPRGTDVHFLDFKFSYKQIFFT